MAEEEVKKLAGPPLGQSKIHMLWYIKARRKFVLVTNVVDLGSGSLDDEDLEFFVEECLERPATGSVPLLRLLLSGNDIGDAGAIRLAKFLLRDSCLETLVLSHNKVGDVGCKALAKALERNHTLKYLVMTSNLVADEGARSLGEMLVHNNHIVWLHLYGNNISPDGVQALLRFLESSSNSALSTLVVQFPEDELELRARLANCLGNREHREDRVVLARR